MTWQKTIERVAEVAAIVSALIVLVAMCMFIFTVGMFVNDALHPVSTVPAQVVCPK